MERTSRSRSPREGGGGVGKSEFWYEDRRRLGRRITLCGRRRCWDVDMGRPCGRMKSCGSYGGD